LLLLQYCQILESLRFRPGAAYNGGAEQCEPAWAAMRITAQQRMCLGRRDDTIEYALNLLSERKAGRFPDGMMQLWQTQTFKEGAS